MLVGCLQDVTEQQRREARLEDAEAFTRGIIDALSLAIGVVDGNGRLITANQVWMAGGNARLPCPDASRWITWRAAVRPLATGSMPVPG